MAEAKFYRYHPETGQDAEDFSDVDPVEFKKPKNQVDLKKMRDSGATFWWTNFPDGGSLHRVERINMGFVIKAMGAKAEWIDEKPAEQG